MSLFHRHRWRPISATQGEYVFLGGGLGTTVLLHCKGCGDLRTKTVNGWWTLAELAGGKP